MLNKYFIQFLILLLTLTSCDPRTIVVISNKSKVDKNISVSYPADFSLPINTLGQRNDSLLTYDHTLTHNTINSRDYYRYPVMTAILSLDTINRTYSFNLKADHEVIVESHWPSPAPTYRQIFIIGNLDTVELKRHGKFFKKSPKLSFGGSWTYTIKK